MSLWPRPDNEIEMTAIRSQGAGGQNVNKVSSAAQLRFDVHASSLPESVKNRLMAMRDHRITRDGVVVIKSQQHRKLEQNRSEAMSRLEELLRLAAIVPRKRIPTRTSRNQKRKRMDDKRHRGDIKQLRGKTSDD